jgi:uncharacterized protein (TIGR02271 family)
MATTVTLADGGRGTLEPDSAFAEPGKAVVRLESGRQVVVPEGALIAEAGGYRLPFTASELAASDVASDPTRTQVMARPAEETVAIPIVEETVSVGKREVVTGGVRLTKRVSEREETVDVPLLREDVRVERVPVNQPVSEAPAPRQEGDTLVVPLLEEVLFVEKRLMLVEEVRITRTRTEVHSPQAVTLRTEEAVVEEITPTEALPQQTV